MARDPNGVPFPGPQQRFNNPALPNRILSPAVGGNVPGRPASQQDSLNMAPAARGTRLQAFAEARRRLQNDPESILLAMQESIGARDALDGLGQNVDQNLLYGNVRALPINEYKQIIVLPQNADTEQTNSALEFAKANGAEGPVPSVSITPPYYTSTYNTITIVQGAGEAVSIDCPANSVVVLDSFDLVSYDEMGEDEVLFGLGHGNVTVSSTTTLNNTALQLLGFRQGWPFDNAKLNGRSRLAPQRGPMGKQTRVVLACQFFNTGNSLYYKPTFHYFEVRIRGWKLSIGEDLRVQNSLVSGDDQEGI